MSLTTIVDTHSTNGHVVAPTDQVDRALQNIVAKPKRANKKTKKDPNAPKRPMGAYMLWLQQNRQNIVDQYCSDLHGREKVTAVTRKAGELWKLLNDEEKSPFVEQADALRTEYQSKMKEYTPDPQFQTSI